MNDEKYIWLNQSCERKLRCENEETDLQTVKKFRARYSKQVKHWTHTIAWPISTAVYNCPVIEGSGLSDTWETGIGVSDRTEPGLENIDTSGSESEPFEASSGGSMSRAPGFWRLSWIASRLEVKR